MSYALRKGIISVIRSDILQHDSFSERYLILQAVNFKNFIQKLKMLFTILTGHFSLKSCFLRFLEKHIILAANAIAIPTGVNGTSFCVILVERLQSRFFSTILADQTSNVSDLFKKLAHVS